MMIAEFEIVTVEIPLRVPVTHALAERTTARNLLVAARDGEGRAGWGESCPRPYVTGETVDGARALLRERLLPALARLRFDSLEDAAAALSGFLDGLPRDQHAAFCAAELAVLDLVSRREGSSAGAVLGPVVRESAQYSGVIAASNTGDAQKYAAFLRGLGVEHVKVKVGPVLETNLGLLDAARRILGDAVELRIDANCAWDGAEAMRQLEAMAPYRLAAVEQPVPAQDLEGMKAVTSARLVPVVADESLVSVEDAHRLIAGGGCDIFNLRVSKCGGLINVGRIHRLARDAGLQCQLGAQVGESGLLSAAGRHYATRCDSVRWCEGSYDRMLLAGSVTVPDITIGPRGVAPALTGPGLGVSVPEQRAAEFAVDRIRVA